MGGGGLGLDVAGRRGAAQEALFDRIVLERGGKQTVSFQLPEIPQGRDVVLAFVPGSTRLCPQAIRTPCASPSMEPCWAAAG